MAYNPQKNSLPASTGLENIRKFVHDEGSYPAFQAPLLYPCISSSSYFLRPKESQGKWSFLSGSLGLQDESALSLGCSVSSGMTVSSGKDFQASSCNLDPNIDHRMGNDKTVDPTNGTVEPSRTEGPKVDLELSLAAGSVKSDVTAVSQGLLAFQYIDLPATSATAQLADEGSSTFRAELSPLPQLQAIEALTPHHLPYHNSRAKNCQRIGCTKVARGASGLCIGHGGGRRCRREGCDKGAEGKTVFCKAHGGGRRCEYLGCTKAAEGCTDYCISHGGGRRCIREGCIRAARGKSGLCIRHGGGNRCKVEGCTKSAECKSRLCISHGGGRRCQYPACTKGAQGSTMYCKAHGGGKRCINLGCTKGAEGSTSFCKAHGGGKRCTFQGGCSKSVHGSTLFCVNHGGGKRCAAPGCTKSARGRTNFCVRHGGGKRCKYEGCGKGAQGRTDFCKAHGRGMRCSWSQNATHCGKFARGKFGFCAAHSELVQDEAGLVGYESGSGEYLPPEGRVHGGGLMTMLRREPGKEGHWRDQNLINFKL